MLSRLALVVSFWIAVPAAGQGMGADGSSGEAAVADTVEAVGGFDVRVLRAVYASPPAVASVWRVADWTSYKVFIGAPVATGLAAVTDRVEPAFAFRLIVAEGVGLVSYYGLKSLFQRERPYRTVTGIASRRASGTEDLESVFDPYSFPSGHATIAFAVATTYALEAREPVVTATALTWAAAVAVSRVWLGVHYPTDVFAGSLLGASIGFSVYALGDLVTPDRFEDDPPPVEPGGVPLMVVRIPIR